MMRLLFLILLSVSLVPMAQARPQVVKEYWFVSKEDSQDVQNYAMSLSKAINDYAQGYETLKGTTCPLGLMMDKKGNVTTVIALNHTKTKTCEAALIALDNVEYPDAPAEIRGKFIMLDYTP
ncbi:hypothetical protein LZ634_04370 [Kluyvera intermedia]|uniref:hypothetical protein n=1 Tax=Kluyvera intermedia TaxID=61648 RepID=UPI001F405DEF|nr:hypothetical protein [Kluyvera intermedia]EKU4732694.1 hypothetical protein [Kluyvera ascorbata]MCE9887947.1 hypothetical protein [Kluyvera intermedia]